MIKCLASGSSGNCYIVTDGITTVLLDAGISLDRIREGVGFKLSGVAGALVSHRHNDHAKSVQALTKAGIDVFALADVLDAKGANGYHAIAVEPMLPFAIGSLTVTPFAVQHDVPNLGFVVDSSNGERLLYFTDTYYVKYQFPGCTQIMCECNYDPEAITQSVSNGKIPIELKKRLYKSHMSIDTLIDFFKANDLSKLRQVYLLHLSDNNSREAEFKAKVQAVTGCEVYVF